MANLIDQFQSFVNRIRSADITPAKGGAPLYEQLLAYYENNGLYDSIMSASFYLDIWHENMKPLRNPANRSVEFFTGKLMPGVLPDALPIVTDNERIIEPIHQLWQWSNLNAKKPMALRWLSIYGDLFIHPATNSTVSRMFLQFIRPEFITDWEVDERGFVTRLRLDVPIGDNKLHTEYWTPEAYWIWEHPLGAHTPIENLTGLVDSGFMLDDFGIDFVPFVHVKFRDVGRKRGWGAFTHALDKIDEANRMATRLHELLFRYNKAIWAAMANQVDATGRPLPPPKFETNSDGKVEMGDDQIIRLPGLAKMESLIPNIHYSEALSILQDHMVEIEKDLPELAYSRLREKGELSGRAIRLLLGDAIDRAEEARANFEQGLIRAESMALTMGAFMGLLPDVGSFDAGDLEHQFKPRDIFEIGVTEKAEALKNLIESGIPLEEARIIVEIPTVDIVEQ